MFVRALPCASAQVMPERVDWSVYVACRVVKDHQKELRFSAQCVPPSLSAFPDDLDALFVCPRPDAFRSLLLDKPAPLAEAATELPLPSGSPVPGLAAEAGQVTAKKPQSLHALLSSLFEPAVVRVPLRNTSDTPLRLTCAGESILFRVHIAARTSSEESVEPISMRTEEMAVAGDAPGAEEAWLRADVVVVPPQETVDLVVTLNQSALLDRAKTQHVLKFR
jgi:hypothetical protein